MGLWKGKDGAPKLMTGYMIDGVLISVVLPDGAKGMIGGLITVDQARRMAAEIFACTATLVPGPGFPETVEEWHALLGEGS